MIVPEESYETSEPTIDAHIVKLKASGADVFVSITTPKFAAQAIKKVGRDRLEAAAHLSNVSASVGGVIKPAGFENLARHPVGEPTPRTAPTRSGTPTPA